MSNFLVRHIFKNKQVKHRSVTGGKISDHLQNFLTGDIFNIEHVICRTLSHIGFHNAIFFQKPVFLLLFPVILQRQIDENPSKPSFKRTIAPVGANLRENPDESVVQQVACCFFFSAVAQTHRHHHGGIPLV